MEIIIWPKRVFDAFMVRNNVSDATVELYWDGWAFISINDSMGTPEVPHFNQDHSNVLRLFFDDVEEDINTFLFLDGAKTPVTVKAFDESMAAKLLTFIKDNSYRKHFVVHCAAGVSRSGAVGTFLNDYFKGNYELFKRNNPHIHPNPTVMRLMNAQLRNS